MFGLEEMCEEVLEEERSIINMIKDFNKKNNILLKQVKDMNLENDHNEKI